MRLTFSPHPRTLVIPSSSAPAARIWPPAPSAVLAPCSVRAAVAPEPMQPAMRLAEAESGERPPIRLFHWLAMRGKRVGAMRAAAALRLPGRWAEPVAWESRQRTFLCRGHERQRTGCGRRRQCRRLKSFAGWNRRFRPGHRLLLTQTKNEFFALMRILLLLALICLSEAAFAQSSTRFTITRGVIAGGGMTFSSSARFQLGGTIAQPLAALPFSAQFLHSRRFLDLAVTDVLWAGQGRSQFRRFVSNQSGQHLHGAIQGFAVRNQLAKPAKCCGKWRGGIGDEFRARHCAKILPACGAVNGHGPGNVPHPRPAGRSGSSSRRLDTAPIFSHPVAEEKCRRPLLNKSSRNCGTPSAL